MSETTVTVVLATVPLLIICIALIKLASIVRRSPIRVSLSAFGVRLAIEPSTKGDSIVPRNND